MRKVIAQPNETKRGFHFPSEYSRSLLLDWLKKYDKFEITPVIYDSYKSRRYLEGAVIPEYCRWQYNIDPRDPQRDEARRYLFKRDFNYEVITGKEGEPVRIPLSSKGKVREILEKFTEWASENGCKIPNPDLYKMWRDEWSMDLRFPTFHDFLTFLNLDCDAMPSRESLKILEE